MRFVAFVRKDNIQVNQKNRIQENLKSIKDQKILYGQGLSRQAQQGTR
jgi:hypothetical protein